MERYYPNYYSPSSACYEPLDPKLRRRSLVDLTTVSDQWTHSFRAPESSPPPPPITPQIDSHLSVSRHRPASVHCLSSLFTQQQLASPNRMVTSAYSEPQTASLVPPILSPTPRLTQASSLSSRPPQSPSPYHHHTCNKQRSFSFRISRQTERNAPVDDVETEDDDEPIISTKYRSTSKDQTHSTYEQNFHNMRNRLQALNATTSEKDSELQHLRLTIATLRQQTTAGGFPPTSMNEPVDRGSARKYPCSFPTDEQARMRTGVRVGGSSTDLANGGGDRQLKSHSSLQPSHSYTSLNSNSDAGSSIGSTTSTRRRKGWLRSSLGKAFRRKKNNPEGDSNLKNDVQHAASTETVPAIPDPSNTPATVQDVEILRRELSERSLQLTDLQLSALSSAHQVEQLREQVATLRADKDHLGHLLRASSPCAVVQLKKERNQLDKGEVKVGAVPDIGSDPMMLDHTTVPSSPARRLPVCVPLRPTPVSELEPANYRKDDFRYIEIGCLAIYSSTSWKDLETALRRLLKSYSAQIDPSAKLGLTADSVAGFQLGPVTWIKDCSLSSKSLPTSPPLNYIDELAKESNQVTPPRLILLLRGGVISGLQDAYLDVLAFETLVPKTILQRYVALILEHRRIMLCGPSGTGKTYLANRLAEFLAARNGSPGLVARFKVEHKSAKELRAYLSNIAEQTHNSPLNTNATEPDNSCTSVLPNKPVLPCVIIIDNIHNVTSIAEIFNSFLSSVTQQKCPFIIGTMNQATFSANSLQLHHNFRWVLCANHMEPVRGFLGRYLRRKLVHWEVAGRRSSPQLSAIVAWIPRLWQTLNDFLESHASSDVTIGPRLFLSCPMDIEGSQLWLTDLWNYSLVPYLLEAVREGLQTFGRRAPWFDPVSWIVSSWPWASLNNDVIHTLLTLRPEDVGYEAATMTASALNGNSGISTSTRHQSNSTMISQLSQQMRTGLPLVNTSNIPMMSIRMPNSGNWA